MVLTILLVGFARAGVALVALLTFFGGIFWLDVAKDKERVSERGRIAAQFTGYAMILGSLCFVILTLHGHAGGSD